MASVRSLPTHDRSVAGFEFDGLPGGPVSSVFEADVELDHSGHAWLPASLPIAMATVDTLDLVDPQDPIGLLHAEKIQQMLAGWYPELHRVDLRAEASDTGARRAGVGCFFSGGVDSFYSAIERQDEITHLIFVHGFDISYGNEELASRARSAAETVAREMGKTLITVRTDVRRISDRWSGWGAQYHGAALGTVGLLLADHVGRVIVPSTFQTADLAPWGSHPDLDPLWSTSRVEFEHQGVELHRADKIAAISSHPLALEHLRVCWRQEDGEYNCGRCSKCIRTMAVLRAYDALESCATFPSRIDASALARIRDPHGYEIVDARRILSVLAERGIDEPELVRELRGLIRRDRSSWRALRAARARLRRIGRRSGA